ncbi:RNA polymerase factor sigma-54 [Salinicoccus jeotgali]|uniref:RNA polymerase factor sigma-54 n=1 Tax=Salinicoccus jeotgali TaxID=381634 RepID=A0ABP7F541_9STAP
MLTLENHVSNDQTLALNHYLFHGIQLFKFNQQELNRYIKDKCAANPLILIDEEKMPLETLAYHHDVSGPDILAEMLLDFKCTLPHGDFGIIRTLIYSLDSNGFLEADPPNIAEMEGVPLGQVHVNLERLKTYDMLGVGCSDAMDYLRFQLINDGSYDEALFQLFSSHLTSIAHDDFSFLADSTVSKDKFLDYVDHIKTLGLSPLSSRDDAAIEPDAFIILGADDDIHIEIPDHLVGSITFEPLTLSAEDPEFDKLMDGFQREYEELVSIMNARSRYMHEVLSVIVFMQKEYLSGRSSYLETLDQTIISDNTSLSPATVSRLLVNKYISTPLGVMPLKALLSKEAVSGASRSKVINMIRQIEGFPGMPDARISKILEQRNIYISRRTVNKYKNEILSGLKEA